MPKVRRVNKIDVCRTAPVETRWMDNTNAPCENPDTNPIFYIRRPDKTTEEFEDIKKAFHAASEDHRFIHRKPSITQEKLVEVLEESLEGLERCGCQAPSYMCKGPTMAYEDYHTCFVCSSIQDLYILIGQLKSGMEIKAA